MDLDTAADQLRKDIAADYEHLSAIIQARLIAIARRAPLDALEEAHHEE